MRRIPPGAPIVTAAQRRAAEQACFDAGVSQDELMERAGTAVAREVRRLAAGKPLLVLAGPGNNGGDAYVAARLLAEWGHAVTVATFGTPKEGAAARMAGRWSGRALPLAEVHPPPSCVVVDGLFGTGATQPMSQDVRVHLDTMRGDASMVVAIDLPSGVEADARATGFPSLRADVTVAIGALKPAHVVGVAAAHCGHVLLADIGVPVPQDWRTLDDPAFREPGEDAHKYSRGMVAVLAGTMPGAARLAARAALAAGAGYVVLAGDRLQPGPLDAIVQRQVAQPDELSALLEDMRIGVFVIGPGLGRDDWAEAMVETALASARDLVIDGDALSIIGGTITDRLQGRDAATYLTPHSGEFDRLFGAGEGNKIERTIAAARAAGAVVVHKGQDTVIARRSGEVRVAAGASPWLSTAGTGDVLAGLIAARHAARGEGGAAETAVWLHGRAAGLAGISFSADALVDAICPALASGQWV